MNQVKPTQLKELAIGAFNQLLAGTSVSKIYENLNLYDYLNDDHEEMGFVAVLDKKAAKLGLVIEDDYLRPRTLLEAFLYKSQGNLESSVKNGVVTLEAKGVVMQMLLSEIPNLILRQALPLRVLSFLSFVYFNNVNEGAK